MPKAEKRREIQSIPLAARVSLEEHERIEVLADRVHANISDVLRAMIEAGLEANPVSETEIAAFRKRRAGGRKRISLNRPSGTVASLDNRSWRRSNPTSSLSLIGYPAPPEKARSLRAA